MFLDSEVVPDAFSVECVWIIPPPEGFPETDDRPRGAGKNVFLGEEAVGNNLQTEVFLGPMGCPTR